MPLYGIAPVRMVPKTDSCLEPAVNERVSNKQGLYHFVATLIGFVSLSLVRIQWLRFVYSCLGLACLA